MRKETTPEEKLLKLIKKKKEPLAVPTTGEIKPEGQAPARLDGVLRSEIFKSRMFEPAVLKNINRYLIIALGIITSYFLADLIFVRPYRNIEKIAEKSALASLGKPGALESKGAVIVKEYESYSSAVSNKNVFGPYSERALSGADNAAASGDISERLGLVGVVTGNNPQAIIEDKKNQKTYYLNKGQSFDGYIVEEISEGKVTLNNGGNRISLFL